MPNIIKFEKEHLSKINLAFELTQSGKDSLASYDDVIGYTGIDKDVILAIGGVHRMWDGVGEAYAQWLGFEKEGIMRKYGPDGTDYIRYARVI